MSKYQVFYSRAVARWAVVSSRIDTRTWDKIRESYWAAELEGR